MALSADRTFNDQSNASAGGGRTPSAGAGLKRNLAVGLAATLAVATGGFGAVLPTASAADPYNVGPGVPITEVSLGVGGSTVIQTATQTSNTSQPYRTTSGVNPQASVTLNSITLLDGTVLDEFIGGTVETQPGFDATSSYCSDFQPPINMPDYSGIAVPRYPGYPGSYDVSDPANYDDYVNVADFEAAASSVIGTRDLMEYIDFGYGDSNPCMIYNEPDDWEFDVIFDAPLEPDDYVLVQERFGNTFFELTPLDVNGNPYPTDGNARRLHFGGRLANQGDVPYGWNTGYAPPNQADQPQWFSVAKISDFGLQPDQSVYGFRVDNDGEADVKFFGLAHPGIRVVKLINGEDANEAPGVSVPQGSTMQLTFEVSNGGTEDLQNISLSDVQTSPELGQPIAIECPATTLAVGASMTCEGTFPAPDAGQLHTNVASVTGVGVVSGLTVQDQDPANATGTEPPATPAVSVGDYVWVDADGDGIQDDDESGLAGVTLTLTGPDGMPVTDVNGDPVAPFTTLADGAYTFGNLPVLPAGESYTVTVTGAPAGYLPTEPGVGDDRGLDSSTGSAQSSDLTTDGASDLTLDFGFVPTVSVGDYVWLDADGDGIQDDDESGLAGVTLTLTGPDGLPVTDVNGDPVAPFTTLADGAYAFENLPVLPAGESYTVTVTGAPAGYQPTAPGVGDDRGLDSSTGSAESGDLTTAGASDPTLDFGFVSSVPSVDIEKVDAAGNDADAASDAVVLPGSSVDLAFTVTNNGNEPLVDVVVTDVVIAGSGVVSPLVCTYQGGVIDVTGAGWAGPLPVGGTISCAAELTGVTGEPHADRASVDAAGALSGDPVDDDDEYHAVRGSVSVGDYVWLDADGDGLQDDDESGLAGVTLTLTGPDGLPVTDVNGDPVAPFTTGADGAYTFGNLPVLPAGESYTVTVTGAPAGYAPTLPGVGDDRGLDSSTGSAESGDLTTPGASDPTLDFGFVPTVSVGDYVWIDADGDGLQDDDESGLAGVTLTLTGPDGLPVTDVNGDPVVPFTTLADGAYSFVDLPVLPAGESYTVTVTGAPAGYAPTLPGVGDDRGADSSTGSAESGDLTTPGASDPTLDFGFVPTVSVGDYVWIDADRDGLQDDDESGLAGVTLTLTGPDGQPVTDVNGDPVAPFTTGADGAYTFENLPVLPAGESYTVTITRTPAGYIPTLPGVGDDRGADSSTGSADSTDLTTPGASDPTLDFGFVPVVAIGDYVWMDTDRDGVQDDDEAPVPGVTVTIELPDGTTRMAVTDDNGFYQFVDLVPNTEYGLVFEAPDGSSWTVQDSPEGTDESDSDVDQSGNVAVTSPVSGVDGSFDAGLVRFNLLVEKSVVSAQAYPGGTVVFSVVPRNAGPADALAGWSVTDVLPEGLTLVSMAGDGYTCVVAPSADSGTCELTVPAPLAAGAQGAPITVTATVDAGVTGMLRNVAYVSPSPDDVTETNPLGTPPASGTDTSQTPTDNDDHADITVELVSIGDYVWMDTDRDGVQDDDESPVPGVTVTIELPDGTTRTAVTDEDGFYEFVDLIPNTEYELVFEAPDGSSWTVQDSPDGTDESDSDVDESGHVAVTSPVSGVDGSFDAGLVRFNLLIEKSLDTPASEIFAGSTVTFTLVARNEGPADALAGWSVTDVLPEGLTLVSMSGDGYTCSTATATCVNDSVLAAGASGAPITVVATVAAGFSGSLKNVAYVSPSPDDVVETVPLGTPPTTDTDTDASVTDNDDQVPLQVLAPVTIGDYVFFDVDHDGIQDEGDQPIAGATMTITDEDGNPVVNIYGEPVGAVVTDENGLYLFEDLYPGVYVVKIDVSTVDDFDGYLPTTPGVGGDRTIDSSTGTATSRDLEAGQSDLTLDFGFWKPGPSISIVKGSKDGKDGDDPDRPVQLPNGSIQLVFKVRNTGNEALTSVRVSDAITLGSGRLVNLVCTFPDGTTGTTWAGPFQPGAEFECTATLEGVTGPHKNVATVTAVGIDSDLPVTGKDPFHADRPKPNPGPPSTGADGPATAPAGLLVIGALGVLALAAEALRRKVA